MTAPIKTVMITGANVGLGYEAARQLASQKGIEKVILACRNPDKALAAKKSLEETTDKRDGFYETLMIDVSNLDSVQKAVNDLQDPIDGLIMNAGGGGGKDPAAMTKHHVPAVVAVNVLGHALLIDLLLEQKKLTRTAVYAGSEAARGIPGFKKLQFKSGSVDEFATYVDGSGYKKKVSEIMYGGTKLVAALWMSSMARKEPKIRFVTMSPGGTVGTEGTKDLPKAKKFLFTKVMFPILKAMGKVHTVEVGAKRYLDALLEEDRFESGVFYGSKKGISGPTADQVMYADYLADKSFQDHANEAIHMFIPREPTKAA